MAGRIVVICILALGSSSAWATPDLCAALPPEAQEEVTYFAESEITADAAKNAISELESDRFKGTKNHGDHDLVVEGNLRLIEGYLLKYKAEQFPSQDSLSKFCTWLQTQGHWPE